jgi:NADH-quinone oxidoreductase subunit M
MNGFIGEFLILLGVFQNSGIWAACATSGIILAACYILWMFQRVMFQKLDNPKNENLSDLNTRELITIIPLIVLVFWIGLYPKPFMKTFDATVEHLLVKVNPDNFRPVKPGSSHSEHAKLIKIEDIAKLNQQ